MKELLVQVQEESKPLDSPLEKSIQALLAGFSVVIIDTYDKYSERLLESIRDHLLRLMQDKKIHSDLYVNALGRVHLCQDSEAVAWKHKPALILSLDMSWRIVQLKCQ